MIGIVLLNKPKGLTSNTAMQKVRRALGVRKAGHTGTLDPMATGMLPICIGRATRLCSYFLDVDKTYRATIQLGEQTSTGDAEGEVVMTKPLPELTEELIQGVFEKFTGQISQIPPMYSALKHEGKKLYELARKGVEIEREPRKITIYHLELEAFDHHSITINVRCSKGTYIRVLGEDIAGALGTCGHLTMLERTACAGFEPTQMHTLEEITDNPTAYILPIDKALDWPQCAITQDDLERLQQGREIEINATENGLHLFMLDKTVVAFGEVDHGQLNWRKLLI